MGSIVSQGMYDAGNGGKTTVTAWRYGETHLFAIDHPNQAERYAYNDQRRVSTNPVILTLAGGAHVSTTTRHRYDALGNCPALACPTCGRGCPPKGLERILPMYIAQQCFGLSEQTIEDAIHDSQSIRGFVGIDRTHE